MAESWQDILDDFAGVRKSASSSKPVSSSTARSSSRPSTISAPTTTSSTTKKKKDWQSILDDFSGASKTVGVTRSGTSVADRIEARTHGGRGGSLDSPTKRDEDDDRKWYQKGLFADGYDFGDVTKTILGVTDETASIKDLTWGSVKRGYYNSIYGEETFKEMDGLANEKEAYKELLESEEYQFTPGNDLAGAISGAFELGGQMFRQATNPTTLGAVAGAIGGAALLGQAGPQVAIPEEVITVPGAAIAAYKAGSAASNLKIEAGHAYNEMIEMGVKEDIAKKIALAVGTGNAGLELVQLDELADGLKIANKVGATDSVAKQILAKLIERGVDVGIKEVPQEVAQELITVGGVQAANYLDKGEFAYSADEVKGRLWDTAKQSALSFGMMNLPGAAMDVHSTVKYNKSLPNNQFVQNEEHPVVEQTPKVEQETKPKVEEVQPVAEKTEIQKLYERRDDLEREIDSLVSEDDYLDNDQYEELASELKAEMDEVNREIESLEKGEEYAPGEPFLEYSYPYETEDVAETAGNNWREIAQSLPNPEYEGEEWTREYIDRNNAVRSTVLNSATNEVIRDVESGLSPEELAQKAQDALREYEDLQAQKDSVSSFSEAEQLTLTALYNQYSMYSSVAKNPSYVNELKKAVDYAPVAENATATTTEEFSAPGVFTSETETTTENSEAQKLRDERQVLQDTIMSRVEVGAVDETTEMLARKWNAVDKQIRTLDSQETASETSEQAGSQETTTSQQADPTQEAYVQRLRDELQSLKDNLTAQPDYDSFKATLDAQRDRMELLQQAIDDYEKISSKEKASDASLNAPSEGSSDFVNADPSTFSEQAGSVISEMVAEDSSGKASGSEKIKHYVVGDFHVVRRLSQDGERYVYNVSYGEFYRTGSADKDSGDFYSHVANAIDSLLYEAAGLKQPPHGYEAPMKAPVRTEATKTEETQPVISKKSAVPADAPVRVVSNDNGSYLETDNSPGEQKWQTRSKPIPRQPKVLTEQPPSQKEQKASGTTKKADGKSSDNTQPKVTDSLNVEPKKLSPLKWLGEYVADHGFWVERLSKKTGNRELDAKWNFIRYARGGAQHLIGKGSKSNGVKSLKSMLDRVDKAGLTEDFYSYMYHWLNYDRMTVEDRYPGSKNIGVFGQAFSASDSLAIVQRYEQAHPEFKEWAEDVYAYNRFLRKKLVDAGIINKRTAALWEEMLPHYVPVRRSSFAEVEADFPNARNAGFNSSVHEFEGSDKDILPMFDTMAQRTLEVYRATAMNGFASELYNTLYPGYAKNGNGVDVPVDFFLEGFDPREELLETGELGSLPTLSFYKNGKRHTFDINSEMYESLKPSSDWLSYKIPGLSGFSNLRRALITEYNPWFVLKNAVKDVQDIVINSQHPLQTYANLVAKAPMEMATNGRYWQEYLENGGNQNTYFDKDNVSYDTDKGLVATLKKVTGLEAISKANNVVEMLPRFAEYIASREAGRSIEESMLDASRVTTNFAAGGKFTKLLNRNGATFLNASVQGFMQQARNIVEAKQKGLKGWASLAARYAVSGIPVFVLNNLIWEDDEEYEELPDYITNNYYIVGKYGDGKFVRIPKGRTAAVIQNAIEQVSNMSSGDDEADWNEFFKLFMENIAPNNPLEDNVFAPIMQVATNKTWYGEDLVPNRLMVTRDEDGNLKEVPTIERHDEKTDSISIWLSEKLQGVPGLKNLELSPKQINYLLDQYSGVVGDTVLPFFTPKAESPSDSFLGKAISPLRDIFTTDSVLNNRVTGDFYETLEAAEAQAKTEGATMSDKLRSGILISANVEISELLKEQRKIQTSDMPDSEKYQRNREIKEEINTLQKDALDSLNTVFTDGIYAEAGDKRYNYSEEDDTWWEVKPELADGKENWYYIQEQLSHDKLGMSYADFWNGRKPPEDFEGKTYYAEYNGKRYNYDVDDNSWYEIKPKKKNGEDNYYYQQEQLAHDKLGVSYEDFWNNREAYMDALYVADRWDEPFYDTVTNVFGVEHFADIASGMADISADKDANGEPISGSRRKKMEAYIYGLDIPEIEKHILFKSQYSYIHKHNYEIIDYLNKRDDISYNEMASILKELGFKVSAKGYITW